jgi:hypothetical protein
MTNPTRSYLGSVDGRWIVPTVNNIWTAETSALQVRVIDQDEDEGRDISAEVFVAPSRGEKIVQLGQVHNVDGAVRGRIESYNGVTAKRYLERLDQLLTKQHRFKIWLIRTDLTLFNVTFVDRFVWRKVEGVDMYDITLPYVSHD